MKDIMLVLGMSTHQRVWFILENLFRGRIGRTQYFIATILLFSIAIFVVGAFFVVFVLNIVFSFYSGEVGKLVTSIFLIIMNCATFLGYMMYMLSLTALRLHDFGMSGWLCLISLIPLINLIFMFVLFFKRVDGATNKYGPVPERRNPLLVILNV